MWLYLEITGFIIFIIFLKVLYEIYSTIRSTRPKQRKRENSDKVKTVIVIGSGGHTTEMLYVVGSLNPNRYSPRIYIMASSDTWSEQKIHEREDKFKTNGSTYSVCRIPRSRSVHQNYFTSIFTSLYSIVYTIPIMLYYNPDLILCNGPGTCIPVCLIAFLMRCLYLSNNVIIFVESICRVKSLSLTGKILHFFADEILVQWKELESKFSRAKYLGRA